MIAIIKQIVNLFETVIVFFVSLRTWISLLEKIISSDFANNILAGASVTLFFPDLDLLIVSVTEF